MQETPSDHGPSLMASLRSSAAVLVEQWNWKAALLSAVGRAPIFLATTHSYGWHSAVMAAALETGYRGATAGLFASMT